MDINKTIKRYTSLTVERESLKLIENPSEVVKTKIETINNEMDAMSFPNWLTPENYIVWSSFND